MFEWLNPFTSPFFFNYIAKCWDYTNNYTQLRNHIDYSKKNWYLPKLYISVSSQTLWRQLEGELILKAGYPTTWEFVKNLRKFSKYSLYFKKYEYKPKSN